MIHETAIIGKNVVIEEGVSIGAYAVIESGVRLAKGVKVYPYVHLKGKTSIGEDTTIGTGCVIGEAPQILGVKEPSGKVYIGKNNIIREYVTINSSSVSGKSTTLGNDNFLMAFSHIAHDCKIANDVVICNGALIAGHVEMQDKVFISGNVVVHQFVRIGRLAMVGGLSRVNQDVPPFMMVVGDSRVCGLNKIGMRRSGFSREDINQVKKAYNFIYRKEAPIVKALVDLEKIESDKVKELTVFLLASRRGISGPRRSSLWEKVFLDYPYFLRTIIPTYKLIAESNLKKYDTAKL